MTHALVTVAAPISVDRIGEALALIEAMGNPAQPGLALALDRLEGEDGVHFASLHAIAPDEGSRGHLVLEFSADGDEDRAVERLAARIGDALGAVFALAQDRGGGDLAAYLKGRKVHVGHGWLGHKGLAFAGTPGMSVGRIRGEAALADHLGRLVGAQSGGVAALDRLEAVRAEVRADEAFRWVLEPPPPLPVQPVSAPLATVLTIVAAFVRTYLWPLAALFVVVLILAATPAFQAVRGLIQTDAAWPLKTWLTIKLAWAGLMWLLGTLAVFAVPVLIVLGVLYLSLRRKEEADVPDERAPSLPVLRRILANENQLAHNHMVSVTVIKPGLTRAAMLRFAFFLITQLATLQFKPGYLGDIGTIHFARWVTLPGTRQLVFFSNFGGSWESYLEDFITKAHDGLTAVWSNSVGFPRTANLIQQGATDGERFKRYARRSMAPTPFWYSAYPTLTTANIRANANIRSGLASARTDEEAGAWLALFGSATRPPAKLESDQIQSLVFGGLGFMPHGQLMLIDLSADRAAVRAWLKERLPEIAFDDGRRLKRKAVLTLALGPGALAKAGLPADAIETFPPAYLDGMTGPGRSRILGDEPDDPDRPWWWRASADYDVALLVYGVDEASVAELAGAVTASVAAHGHAVARVTPLHRIPEARAERLEPFGFVDGTSQPVIRGTYRGLRNADPIHLVEAGEFILGYPDNRGNIPPGPSLEARHDPGARLPIRCDNASGFGPDAAQAPREIGRNGSFLVIRQLEQDVDGFHSYCAQEAQQLQGRLGEPYEITPAFIGAKLVGRWQDGSSLARNPYRPLTGSGPLEQRPTRRPASNPETEAPIAPPPVAADAATAPAVAADPAKPFARNAEDNDFLLGTEDPQGLRCPFGAHIRRANPRDSLEPGSQDQIDISNRHRILRLGRTYVAQAGQQDGLMFMCLNGDIERQFEFVQQTWMGSETFHGLSGERDALAGVKAGCPNGFTIPTRDGPIRLAPMARFVTPRGGGYFFLPGKRLLEFLSD